MTLNEIILSAAVIAELIIIIILIIRRDIRTKSSFNDFFIKVLIKDNVNPDEIDRYIKKDNELYAYIAKSYAYFNNREYQKCRNILLTLLAKKDLKSEHKNIIYYLVALCLFNMKKYEEAGNYADKIRNGLFGLGKEPINVFILKTDIGMHMGKADNIKNYIKSTDICYATSHIVSAFEYSGNENIILNALSEGLDDQYLLTVLLERIVNKKDAERIIFRNIGAVDLTLNQAMKIIEWINKQDTEKILRNIDKSTLNSYVKKSFKLYLLHISGENDTDIKLIIEDIRKNEKDYYTKNPYIITEILMKTGYYRYAQLFM